MSYTARNITEKDYDMFLSWWKYFRFSAPPKIILPNNGLDGIIIQYNNTDVVAGFLYATSSSALFWIEWIVSNPEIKDKEVRKKSILLLINILTDMAKKQGAMAIYTTLKNKHLLKHYSECGFVVSGNNNIEMIKNLY